MIDYSKYEYEDGSVFDSMGLFYLIDRANDEKSPLFSTREQLIAGLKATGVDKCIRQNLIEASEGILKQFGDASDADLVIITSESDLIRDYNVSYLDVVKNYITLDIIEKDIEKSKFKDHASVIMPVQKMGDEFIATEENMTEGYWFITFITDIDDALLKDNLEDYEYESYAGVFDELSDDSDEDDQSSRYDVIRYYILKAVINIARDVINNNK